MTSDSPVVLLENWPEHHIAKITLNRPQRLNALSEEMEISLADSIEAVKRDDQIRVLIVTGSGRTFCAGADLARLAGSANPDNSFAAPSSEQTRQNFQNAHRVILGIHKMEKPVIASVNGPAVGAGFDIACASDIRLGSSNTRFIPGFLRVGLFPGYGGTWLYPRIVHSLGKAAEILFTGETLEADEAYRVGLLNKLVPPNLLDSATWEMATKIANGPPIAIRLAKTLLHNGLEMSLDTALEFAAAAETITLMSKDHLEGAQAFREKRKPEFNGN